MVRNNTSKKTVIFRDSLEAVENVYDLEYLGAGHDGLVFKLGDKALKLLKYDIKLRKDKGLMTFDKALYFKSNLDLKRVVQPRDILLDEDGIYVGYVMDYLQDLTKDSNSPTYRTPGDFLCGDLVSSINDLEIDFQKLSSKHVVANDINKGSYIFASDYLHMCDMDKFKRISESAATNDINISKLNFFIAKLLFFEMLKGENSEIEENREELRTWVKKSTNSVSFLDDIRKEIDRNYSMPISEFANEKKKILIRQ